MRRTVFAATLVCALVFVAVSFVQAQSAEDFIKGQSQGIRYARRMDGIVTALYVSGDQLTEVFEEGPSKGLSRTIHIIGKRKEGNKLILDDGDTEYIIDAYTLARTPKSGIWGSGIVYMRE